MSDYTPPPAAPQPAAAAPLTEAEDVNWASLSHLLGILGFIPALVIWLVFKDRGPRTNVEAKEALNFQIAAVIVSVAIQILNAILTAVTFGIWAFIGWILPVALWVVMIIFSIQGYQKVKAGGSYRYPLTIRLIK